MGNIAPLSEIKIRTFFLIMKSIIANSQLKELELSAILLKAGEKEKARKILTNLLKTSLGKNNGLNLKYYIFASALLKQTYAHQSSIYQARNIYLRKFKDLSQIEVFELISQRLPVVYLVHQVANDLIYQIIKNQSSVILLDIGIGKGSQIERIIKRVGQNQLKLKLKIIGIDPNPKNLEEAKKRLSNITKEYKIEFEFLGSEKLIENLTKEEWLKLASYGENLIINSCFSLHHTLPEKRQEIIQKISNLNPKAVILGEPDSDHNTSDLVARFNNSWNLFSVIFNLIDRLNITERENYLLKESFFGREIEDILGNEESLRSERHESTETWLKRFCQEKFKPFRPLDLTCENIDTSVAKVEINNEYVGIQYENTNLTSVMCFQK